MGFIYPLKAKADAHVIEQSENALLKELPKKVLSISRSLHSVCEEVFARVCVQLPIKVRQEMLSPGLLLSPNAELSMRGEEKRGDKKIE